MALEDSDWQKIYDAIRKALPTSNILQAKVVRADIGRNVIWVAELGEQPIPLFAFNYLVTYYDTVPTGVATSGSPITTELHKQTARVKVQCPKVGDIVLILLQHGSRALPKCVGVLRSTGFLAGSED